MTPEQAAFLAGWQAAWRGAGLDACPHAEAGPLRSAWHEGHRDGSGYRARGG